MSVNVPERTPTSETPRTGSAHDNGDTGNGRPQPRDSLSAGTGDDDHEFVAKIAAAQAGCTETLGEILASLQAYLFMIAGQYSRQSADTQQNPSDIVQMAHMEAIRHFHQFRGSSRGELLGWVKRILLSNVHDEWRKANSRRISPNEDLSAWGGLIQPLDGENQVEPSPSVQLMQDERALLVREVLAQLPNRYRDVIILYHFEGHSMKEIAALWQCSEDAVSKVWGRALESLGRQVKRLL